MTLVKICGITNEEDAMAAVDAGADMIGFVFARSPREVKPEEAFRIISSLPQQVQTVGVFTEESQRVLDIADMCNLDYAQLHGNQSEEFASKLGADRVIRAVRVRNAETVDSLSEYRQASFYLLDAYVPGSAGGTGESFDWDLALDAGRFGIPFILAGGLNPDNVADAVRRVRPFGVDVSSGVETSPGKKNHNKIKELIENVRSVDRNA